MALRLIEMVLQEKEGIEVQELLKEHNVLEHWQIRLPGGGVLARILLNAEECEPVLDFLEKQYAGQEGRRIMVLPVEATLPRNEPKPSEKSEGPSEHISREELFENIKSAARCSKVYLTMVILSTLVASVGLQHNSVAIIIGAMVIAPLLGPNMALALATTLGDLTLLRSAFLANITGIATTIVLSVLIGAFVHIDPAVTEIVSSMKVGLGNIIVALASGCGGALSFTTGVSATLIGVMVAVALLPPLVAFGLLLGSGHVGLSMVALSLFLMNLICVNLAGVITFLVQGIRPANWWEKDRAVKATRIAISLWVLLLAALFGLILLLQKDLI